eukprot:16449399-Heterocapsa_arctica.AAC.1
MWFEALQVVEEHDEAMGAGDGVGLPEGSDEEEGEARVRRAQAAKHVWNKARVLQRKKQEVAMFRNRKKP